MMVKLSQAPLAPRAKVHVLRGVCDRLFLTSMQCRQLVGVFGDSECRMAVLCCALMRLSDPQNMKLVQSRLDAKEWKGLRQRMGTLTLFPYIQPEQQDFALDMSIPEDRIAASLVVRLNVKETKRNNIRNPRFVMHDKSEFAFDRGGYSSRRTSHLAVHVLSRGLQHGNAKRLPESLRGLERGP